VFGKLLQPAEAIFTQMYKNHLATGSAWSAMACWGSLPHCPMQTP